MRVLQAVIAAGGGLAATLLAGAAQAGSPMSISPQQAYDLGEVPSPRPLAMGGALNALGVSTAALFLNPANMPFARVYHLEGSAAYAPEDTRQTYGAAIVDSMVNPGHLSGGLSADWSELDPNGIQRSWTDVRLALAMPLGDHFAIGATGRWLRVEQARGAGPFGSDVVSDGGGNPLFNALTFDAGVTGSFGGLRVGVVGHNLTNPGTALAPTTGAVGVGYSTSMFSVEADGMLDFTTWNSPRGRVMAGGELFLADRVALRAGWRYDDGMNINTASLGLGYIDPQWSVEFAYRHDLISEHASSLMVLSFRYFYDALGGTTSPVDQPDTL